MQAIWSKIIGRKLVPGQGPRKGARPPAAVEIATTGVVAATGATPAYGFAPLAPGTIAPGVAETNLRNPAAVAAAVRQALDAVRPPKRAVTLLVPDTAARVFVLDFDTLPTKAAEALPILRFRLRKMVPFEVEHAGLGYQILSSGKEGCNVLVSLTPAPVLAEYELAVRTAGYEPGAVLPAALAVLETVGEETALVVAHLSQKSLTTAITRGDDLLLYRTQELPTDEEARHQQIQRDIAVAAAFYEDKMGAAPGKIHYSGELAAEVFAQLAETGEMRIVELAPHPETGAATALGAAALAAVTGALTGAGR